MRVHWSARALAQLRSAHEYINRNNAPAARGFVEATAALVELLGEHPGVGIETDEPGVTMFPLVRYHYLVFYKISPEDEVWIVRLRHASRKRLH